MDVFSVVPGADWCGGGVFSSAGIAFLSAFRWKQMETGRLLTRRRASVVVITAVIKRAGQRSCFQSV